MSRAHAASSAWRPLYIHSPAMCCALGHHSAAAIAAIDAHMNHLQETAFRCDGQVVHGATVHGVGLQGTSRHAALTMQVWYEATSAVSAEVARQHLPVLLLSASPTCSGMGPAQAQECLAALHAAGLARHPASRVLSLGKAGIADAMFAAEALLAGRGQFAPCPYVVVIGIDSLLTAEAISRLHSQSRLKLPNRNDGLIPGEAAAAVLLCLDGPADRPGVWIDGVGQGPATDALMDEGESAPIRGIGLVRAIRQAAASAGCGVSDLDFHVSGVSGEARQFREVALALGRAMERRVDEFDHHPIARGVGETGAAAPVLAMAWLSRALLQPATRAPGRKALLHVGNDSGERSALVLRARFG
jgi:3-oxoacyl-[acyl-carrier-protein] synthase I